MSTVMWGNMKIKNLKIGTRLSGAFGLVLLMLVVVAVLGMTRMSAIQSSMQVITKANNVETSMATAMRASVADRMIALRNIVLLEDTGSMSKEVDRIKAQAQAYTEAEKTLRITFDTYGVIPEETALLASIGEANRAAQPIIDKVIALGLANKSADATKILMRELRAVQFKWNRDLQTLEDSEKRQNDEATVVAGNTYVFARNLMYSLSAAAVVFGLLIAWLITRSIIEPIHRAVAVAQTVSAGDLTSEIEVTASDETGMLLGALKAMNDNLRKIVGEVRSGTETMSTASQEIAAGNLDLSSRTEEQASSLEETASSMEELTSTVKQNSDNARQANSLAVSASAVASRGGAVVAQVVTTMEEINESSKKIVDIISVIDGIAFQTNILALNAAVEAARAGEQGRGFAVVATEVRNLAHRSAAAAKEIKLLIGDSVDKVDNGSKLVHQAGITMSEVVESIRQVGEIISEISAAGTEQTLGIEQINQAIIEMDSVTQQNAALVEQSAAAAESLQDQAASLEKVVSMFVLEAVDSSKQIRAAKIKVVPKAVKAFLRTAAIKDHETRAVPPAQRLKVVSKSSDAEWEEF